MNKLFIDVERDAASGPRCAMKRVLMKFACY